MIDELLPPSVSGVDTRGDDVPTDLLFPQEEEAVRLAVPKRQREYRTVRACARRALAELGLPPVPVLSGPRGEPLWPEGVVGSMTHCDGYRAAAVARAAQFRTVGIDAEPHAALPAGVLDAIALPDELIRVTRDSCEGNVHWDRLLFSAKESIFKATYPVSGIALEFSDAEVTFVRPTDALDRGEFDVRLTRPVPMPPSPLRGGWLVRDGLVLTVLIIK